MKPPRRILLIRPSALGDVCRTVPLVASLQARWPNAHIDWLVNAPYADAIRAHLGVARAIPFERKAIATALRRGNPKPVFDLMKQLRRGRYDIAIDAQGLARSAALAWLSGAPVRVGHRDAREFGWAALTHRVPPAESPHTVDRMLSLLGPLGVPVVRDMRLTTPANCNSGLPSDAEPIVLAPTSLWPGKQWPSDRFAELASRLHARGIGPFVVVGGPGEREQCLPLLDAPGIPIIDRVGKTSVGELMAIIEHARLVVANDSAALHIAVGYDKPIVALFGPTKTHLVGPYRRDSDVLQHADGPADSSHKDAAAGRAMMERITVDEVERAVLDRL